MHRALITFYDWVAQVDVPERTRLAATIDRWQNELLAYADTAGASNGKVEAINGEIDQLLRTARGSATSTTFAPGFCPNSALTGTLQRSQGSEVDHLKTEPLLPR